MIREALYAHREGPCCRCGGQEYTWGELHEKAVKIAAFLLARGEKRVLLYGPKNFNYLTALAACVMAGVTYIAASEKMPEERIGYMAVQSEAGLVIDMAPKHQWEKLPVSVKVICITDMEAFEKGNFSLPDVAPEEPAYLLFTSGSTGVPKGVCVTYGNLEHFLRWFTVLPAVAETAPRVVLNQAEFSFDLSVADVYYTFLQGGCLVLPTAEEMAEPEARLAMQRQSGAELAVMTPSGAELCLLDDRFEESNLPELKVFFFCGEVLRPSVARRLFARFPRVRMLNAYGPTEATCAVCAAEITSELAAGEHLPIGEWKNDAVQISLVTETGGEAAPGEHGRVVLTGESVAAGYLGGESGFSIQNGCRSFVTGDIGYRTDGYLWYEGRADDQLKYKGYRLEPGEIESVLCAIPGIMQAVVLPRRLPDGRVTALEAYLVGTGHSEEELQRLLREKLPEYMVPRRMIFRDALPMTANGKIDRKGMAEHE